MTETCRYCGKDIVRTLTAGLDGWGHLTNPGPNHHYASPASKSGQEPARTPNRVVRVDSSCPPSAAGTSLVPEGQSP